MTYTKSKTVMIDKHNIEFMYINDKRLVIKTKTSNELYYIYFDTEKEAEDSFNQLSQ